jgi:hypothetical protein
MLREHIIPFDGQFIIKEERLDFGGMMGKKDLCNIKTPWLRFSGAAGLHFQRLISEKLLLRHLRQLLKIIRMQNKYI